MTPGVHVKFLILFLACSDMLVFVTEPVQCSVSNVLGNYTNIPQPLPFAIKNFEMDDIEIRIGMLGVSLCLHLYSECCNSHTDTIRLCASFVIGFFPEVA